MIFRDRQEAGKKLAELLRTFRDREDTILIALPRGGVPVASEIAKPLGLPIEVFITRKIRVPGDPELVAGAVAENGVVYVDRGKVEDFSIHPLFLGSEIRKAKKEIADLQKVCRFGQPGRKLKGYTGIVVDDGIASGTTIFATIQALKKEGLRKMVVAVPVISLDLIDPLKDLAGEIFSLARPFPLFSVGAFYEQYRRPSDAELKQCLLPSLVGAASG